MSMTTMTLMDIEPKFHEYKQKYDRVFQQAVADGIPCSRTEFQTFTYEKVPNPNEYIADEGEGYTYKEHVTRIYTYDIMRVTSAMINQLVDG